MKSQNFVVFSFQITKMVTIKMYSLSWHLVLDIHFYRFLITIAFCGAALILI